jgi:hypothetical protein
MMNRNANEERGRKNFAGAFAKAFAGLLVAVFIGLSLAGCGLRPGLNTGPAATGEISGTYNVIYFGANFAADYETVAILDVAGDSYEIVPYAPEFRYRVKKDVPAKEALAGAEHFAGQITGFHQMRYSKILDPGNKVVGYEVRPLYYPTNFGLDDLIDVYYWVKDDKIMVDVTLKRRVRQMIEGDGEPRAIMKRD